MGLDSVELLMEVENIFDIHISDADAVNIGYSNDVGSSPILMNPIIPIVA